MARTIPIETISPIEEIQSENINEEEIESIPKSKNSGINSIAALFACLVLLFLGALLIFGLSKPYFVLNPATEELDWGKLSLASFIAALLATIIIWAIFACCV